MAIKNKEVLDSIEYAKRIQAAILPPDEKVQEHLANSFVLYLPKDIVAGDFYWMETSQKEIMFAAADCTGHGVPGALVSVVCHNALNRSVREHKLLEPGEILDKTREIVIDEFGKSVNSEDGIKDGMDIALCSLHGKVLKYAGANNPLWIVRKGDVNANDFPEGSKIISENRLHLIEVKANKQPIGQFFTPTPFQTHTIELLEGDTIYVFSDGYADQFGGDKGKKFKNINLKKLLLSMQSKTLGNQKEELINNLDKWKGSLEQIDDACVIGVKI